MTHLWVDELRNRQPSLLKVVNVALKHWQLVILEGEAVETWLSLKAIT